jgi:L-asparaginase
MNDHGAPVTSRLRPRVDVLALGGTIAMAPASEGDAVTPRLTAESLVAAVPGLAAVADVRPDTVRTMPGASLDLPDLLDVVRAAREAVDGGAAGVVVTQGTDSLEETAYALDLLWDRAAPLVVTGAMRPATAAGADGPGNVAAAVATACADASRERGCLVVFADEIFAARDVAKLHSTRPSAFGAPGSGPLGVVHEGEPRFVAPPPARPPALVPAGDRVPEVALVPAVLGDTGRTLRAVAEAGFDGIVLAAMGAGHIPERLLEPLGAVVARVPVAAASRTGAGALLHDTYGFRGSERDLHALGLLDGGALAPLKARILLTLSLWGTGDRAAAEGAFAQRAG